MMTPGGDIMSNTDINLSVGKHIRKLRMQRGWSQEELAYQSKLTSAHSGHIERGEQNPTLETLSKIAGGLQVEIQDLFNHTPASIHNSSNLQWAWFQRRLERLPLEQQNEVLRILSLLFDMLEK